MSAPQRRRSLVPPSPEGGRSATWAPEGVPSSLRGLRYVVVDEVVGSTVGLTVCDWPELDDEGRLLFASDVQLVGAPEGELQAFLDTHRLPAEFGVRPLRTGDVFAVRVKAEGLARLAGAGREDERLEPVLAPEDWIDPPVYDVTPDARDAAKVAYYSAVTPTLDPEEAASLAELEAGRG